MVSPKRIAVVAREAETFHKLRNFVAPFFNLAVDITAYGVHHIEPKGKLILVCNHRSDMDPFVITAVFPRFISWVAADYTFRIPLFKDLAEKTGCIPMAIDGNISLGSIKKIQQVFKRGDVLGIFPEGHDYMIRNDFTAPMIKFHNGFSTLALRNKVDVLPCVIVPVEEKISDIPVPPIVRGLMGMPKEVCDVKKRVMYKKVNLIFGEKLKIEDFQTGHLGNDTKHLAEETRRRMEDLQNSDLILA